MKNNWSVTIESEGPGLQRITERDGCKSASQIIRDPAASDEEWEEGTSHTVWEMNYVTD